MKNEIEILSFLNAKIRTYQNKKPVIIDLENRPVLKQLFDKKTMIEDTVIMKKR